MAKTLQFRRDTTANLASVTGAEGEIFIDLTKDTVVVMDGSTSGGKPLATESFVTTAVSNLIDSAPGTLDTLNELAAALGDDANFSTSISNTVATAGSYANSAYTQANTARTHGNSAFVQANTARTHANSAFARANSAFTAIGQATGFWDFEEYEVLVDSTTSEIARDATIVLESVLGEKTFTFEADGTFVSESLLAGEILIADNIITPMNIVSVYGETEQSIIVNGDLEVSGKYIVNSNAEVSNTSSGILQFEGSELRTAGQVEDNGEYVRVFIKGFGQPRFIKLFSAT